MLCKFKIINLVLLISLLIVLSLFSLPFSQVPDTLSNKTNGDTRVESVPDSLDNNYSETVEKENYEKKDSLKVSGGCEKDTDCEGERICVDGKCVSADEENVEKETKGASVPLGKFSIYYNPLGALLFGPILGCEPYIDSNLVFDIHIRFSALGLAYNAIATEGFEYDLYGSSMAVGIGIRGLIQLKNSNHRPYVGGFIEYAWDSGGEDYYDYLIGLTKWRWKTKLIILAANGGYRWRIGKIFFLGLGADLGVGIEIQDEETWHFPSAADEKNDCEKNATFFGMIELVLGLEFGR